VSDYKTEVVICDRCYPDDLPAFTFFPLEGVKGVFRGSRSGAWKDGWEERDYGDICPDCAKMEAEEAGEEGEVVMGEEALKAAMGETDES